MFRVLLITVICLVFAAQTNAQKIAVISTASATPAEYSENLTSSFPSNIRVLDSSMAKAAFDAMTRDGDFNLTNLQARNAGNAIGCDFLVIVRAEDQLRNSFELGEHYESWAAVYLVSTRSGKLVRWAVDSATDKTTLKSRNKLVKLAISRAGNFAKIATDISKSEANLPLAPTIEELPTDPRPNLQAPVPYRRIKPEYTRTAYLYSISATVEITVDLDADGKISRTEITRWAGYGLDESVETGVRAMNWRPAYRDGKPIPMRFFLRYNFKKPDSF